MAHKTLIKCCSCPSQNAANSKSNRHLTTRIPYGERLVMMYRKFRSPLNSSIVSIQQIRNDITEVCVLNYAGSKAEASNLFLTNCGDFICTRRASAFLQLTISRCAFLHFRGRWYTQCLGENQKSRPICMQQPIILFPLSNGLLEDFRIHTQFYGDK